MLNPMGLLKNYKHYLSYLDPTLLKLWKFKPLHRESLDQDGHISRAADWICRAQDAFADGGVARSYSLTHHMYFRSKGWVPSYPETTGYIIPTLFDVALLKNNDELYQRAVRMAEWESDIQMENGAVMGGTADQTKTPAVFNTGQVIFGWARAYRETGREKFLESAIQAGDYLLSQQDADGAWRKNLSNYASERIDQYTYNTRTAWSLALLGKLTGRDDFNTGCRRNIDYALKQQTENGWFKNNCLNDPVRPLLHTIAYCIRGITESAQLLGSEKYLGRAQMAADALLGNLQSDGSLSGRFDAQWGPAAGWSCLTGDAQTSIIWGRFYQITGNELYLEGMQRINSFLKKVQILQTEHKDLQGGIAGSYPLNGGYGAFEILNWAVKFFIDALLLEGELTGLWNIERPCSR